VLDGRRLHFGFEGIWQGTAVLYDRETASLWMHLTGECFAGPLAGARLAQAPTGRHTTWADWRASHPATDVMKPEPRLEGARDDRGYFPREAARSGDPRLPSVFGPTIQTRDPRLELHDLVYGVVVDGKARAYPFERLARGGGVVEERLGAVPATVWFDARARSAAAFDARLGGRVLTFERLPDGGLVDRETGSAWGLDGRAVRGPLEGRSLAPLRGLMTEWYGWYASYPTTTLWDG
jgi:hypothetical protein